jgi:hypothetical protein
MAYISQGVFAQKVTDKGQKTWDPEAAAEAFPSHVENIIRKNDAATPTDRKLGEMWYRNAHIQAIAVGQGNVERGAGIVAALSPRAPWDDNIAAARRFAETREPWEKYTLHAQDKGQTRVQNDKAMRILSGEHPLDVLGGMKERSFYHNILDPENPEHITIDKHAHDIAMGISQGVRRTSPELGLGAKSRYQHFSDAYRTASDVTGIVVPLVLQATTWVTHREGR